MMLAPGIGSLFESITVPRIRLLRFSAWNILDAMQSFDPSFRLMTNTQFGSDPNALPEMYIRGRSGIGVRDLDKDQHCPDYYFQKVRLNVQFQVFLMH